MYLQLLVCVALACRCSQAKPLIPSQVHERDTETQTTDLSDHDYVLNFLNNRKSFIAANCNMSFNGQKVSPHICNTITVKIFTSDSNTGSVMDENVCSIDFSMSLKDYPRERVVGAELALYKLNETNTSEEASYDVYISQRSSNNFNQFARVKSISSTESGWQVFNVDTIAAQWSEDDIITLRVLIIRHDGTILPCSSAMTPFVIYMADEPIPCRNRLVNIQPRPKEMKNYVPVVTVFTITDKILPSPPHLCTLFPNSPECQSRRLRRETTILSLGSPNTNQGKDSCSDDHNFALTIFYFRIRLKATNCTAPFNGQTVSALHCNREANIKLFCVLEQVPIDIERQSFACDIQFNITVDEGEKVLGADLALFKLQEENSSESITYDLLIIHRVTETFYSLVNPQRRQLRSTASGWQVFSIDSVSPALQPGDTSLVQLTVYVTKITGDDIKTLSCEDISSLLVLNGPVGDSGSAQSLQYPSPYQESWEDYVPVLTTFTTKTVEHRPRHKTLTDLIFGFKRSISNPHSTATSSLPVRHQRNSKPDERDKRDKTSSKGCQVTDNEVHVQELFPGATVIAPIVANLRQCSTDCTPDTSILAKHSFQDTQCKPTKQSDLDVLLRTGDSEPITIQLLTDAIIQECSCL